MFQDRKRNHSKICYIPILTMPATNIHRVTRKGDDTWCHSKCTTDIPVISGSSWGKLLVELNGGSEGPGGDPWPVCTIISLIPAALEARQTTNPNPRSHMEMPPRCFISSLESKELHGGVTRSLFIHRLLFRLIRNHVLLPSVKLRDFVCTTRTPSLNACRVQQLVRRVTSVDHWVCSGLIIEEETQRMRGKVTFHNAWWFYSAYVLLPPMKFFFVANGMSLLWCMFLCVEL